VLTQEPGTERSILSARSSLDAPSDDTPGTATPNQQVPDTATLQREWTIHSAKLGENNTSRLAICRTYLSDEQLDLVRNLCGQAELAIDRVRLTADLDSSRREAERARLQSALLTSVSHDLRTPLASIIGAASTLRELEPSLTPRDRTDLLDSVMGEARRLNGYIQNLLDMTRIEHGELRIHRDWENPADLIGGAIRLVRENWPDAAVETRIAADVGLVHVHGELFIQALHNVIDNALRYSSPSGPVEIVCARTADAVQIEVTDAGPGLTDHERDRIFDMFYRAEAGDRHSGGTGLGLAITRGIMEAHEGEACAAVGPDGIGTRIVLILPGRSPGNEPRDADQ
jgi:two-component system sensor histidine kinase KdpD